jgi:hypothetical protein
MEDTLYTEAVQQDPPRKKLWNLMRTKELYTKSYEDFDTQFNTPEQMDKLHKFLTDKQLYTKTSDDFKNQFSINNQESEVKKKEPTPSPVSDGALQPQEVPTAKKLVGSVAFPELEENIPTIEMFNTTGNELVEADPFTLSQKYNEYKDAKKVVPGMQGSPFTMGTTGASEVEDEEKTKAAKKIKEYLTTQDINPDEFYSETKDISQEDKARFGKELITERKENPVLYQRKVASLKWQDKFKKSLNDLKESGFLPENEYQSISNGISELYKNAGVGNYSQQKGLVKGVANSIRRLGGEKADEMLKDFAVEVSKVYGSAYNYKFDEAIKGTPESKYLNPTAQLGYDYIKDVDPEKAKQYERLFIDPSTLKDKPDELRGYNHLMQTLEETSLGIQENSVTEELNKLKTEAKKNDGLSAESFEKANKLETKLDEITKAKNELDVKYPNRIEDKVDDAMQEILGQRANYGGYLFGKALTATAHTIEGLWEAVSSPFMTDASNSLRELAIMGENIKEQYTFHQTDKNKGFVTDNLVFKPELQVEIDKIKNNKLISEDQKSSQLYQLLKNNLDNFGRVPIHGGKLNLSPSSILYGVTDIGTTLLPFMAIEAATGGIGGAGTAAKFLRTFSAAAATGFHDEYSAALMEGKVGSEAYRQAMGMTAITAAAMAGAGTAEKVKEMFTGSKTSAAKIILSMSDDAIEAGIKKAGTKKWASGLKALKDRAKEIPKQLIKGAEGGFNFEVAMNLGNEAKSAIYNTEIDREQNFKRSLLGIVNFSFMGAGLGQIGYKSATQLQRSALLDFGKKPTEYLSVSQQMLKDGQLTPAEFEHRESLIKVSGEAYKSLPKNNDKGKPLTEKEKSDYLFNAIIKNESKKAASNLPPKQAEKEAEKSLVADYKNQFILDNTPDSQLESRQSKIEEYMSLKDENGKVIELEETTKNKLQAELIAIKETIEERAAAVEPTPSGTKVEEVVPIIPDNVQGEDVVDNPALKDVESTAKALEGNLEYFPLSFDYDANSPLEVSEAYHKAKADGTNSFLVEAVEKLLQKESQVTGTENLTEQGEAGSVGVDYNNMLNDIDKLYKTESENQNAIAIPLSKKIFADKSIMEGLPKEFKGRWEDIYGALGSQRGEIINQIKYLAKKQKEQSLKETPKAGSVGVGDKSDADIENRMAEIEGAKIGTPELAEFNALEKEMEKRERLSVFNVPLDKVNESVDALMQKEKDMPNGYGAFIEKRDATETKEVADRYLNAKKLTDAELKQDFSDAVRGNPTTWYADGLKMREALKEATNRGIDTKDMLAEVTKVYTDAGYDIETAKSVVAGMLKPVFEGSQKVNEKQLPQSLKEQPKEETTEQSGKEVVVEVAKPKEYVSKTGRSKIVYENGNRKVIDVKTGEEVSAPTARKVLREAQENYDYTVGEKATKDLPDFEDNKEHANWVVENSENPAEIATVFRNEEKEGQSLSTEEEMIAEYGIGKVKASSYYQFGDRNNMTLSKARNYLGKDPRRSYDTRRAIDVIAKEMSDHYKHEITPKDIVDFMDRFPNGEGTAMKLRDSEASVKAQVKFEKLTGLPLNDKTAEIAINQEFNKLSKQEQSLLNQDYETRQQLEDAYWEAHEKTNGFTKESVDTETKLPTKEITNEPTTEVREPIQEVKPDTKEQGDKKGVSEGTKPISEGGAETTTPILKDKETKIKDFNAKADKIANDLIDFLTPKTMRGAATKGLTIADLVTGANEVIKSTYALSLNVKEAIDAGIKYFKENWKSEEHGVFPEAALREKLASQMEGVEAKEQERRFTKQMLETEDLTPESKEKVKETLEYVEQTNAMSVKEASDTIDRVGLDESFNLIMNRNNNVNGGVRATIGQVLIKKYNELSRTAPDESTKNFYLDKTIEVAEFVTEKLATDAGQQIQAFSMWERLSPEGQLRASVKDMKKMGDKTKSKIKKDVDKIGNALQDVNNVVAEQITQKGKTKSAAERLHGRIAKKGQDKVAKAREARANILKKYQADKGKNLYAGIGLTKEGIEFVGNMAKTYLDEGIGRAEIIAEKILKHLQDVTGKNPNDEVIRNVNDIAQTHALKAGDVKIAKGVKDIENEINKIVKEHYTVKEESKKSLINKFIDKLGLEKEEATQLAKEIQTEFDNIANRKKSDILDREIRRLNKIKSKQLSGGKVERKQVQDEIIKFSNLGAFDNGKLLDVISERLGIGKISPTEAAKIIELANKIQEAPIGMPKKNATIELLKYRANLKGTNWGEVAQGVWYANILSGYATHVKNILSTTSNVFSFLGVEAISNPRAVPFLMLGMSKGLTKGLSEAYHTLVTGETPIHIAKIEIPDILERKNFKGGLLNPANWFKFVGRAMKAEDVLLFQGLKEMRATQLAYREANVLGLKNPFSKKTYAKVNELLFNTKERLEAADEQIKQENLKGMAAMRRRYELMEMSRPQEMTDAAYGFAAKGTFNHNTEGTLGALSDAISGFLDNSLQMGGTKPLRFLVPFTRIITNVANNSLDFSPIGLIRGAAGKRGLFASEASGKRVTMTPEERRQMIIKSSLGIATMATAYALSKNGIIQITGAGPSNIDKKLQLIEEGWQPFSIKIGDTFYSYKLTPMVFALGVIGSIRDHEEYDKDVDEDTLTDRIALTLYNSMKLISDMTWVSSAAPIMSAISSDNSNKATSMLSTSVKNSVKSFLVPNFYTQGAQKIEQMFSIPQKEANNLGQLLIKDIPIARNSLNNRINALGDEVVKDVDLLKSRENPDPVWKYLLDKKGWVAPVNKNTLMVFDSKTGEDRPATEDEYYNFSKNRGEKIKSQIQNFLSGNIVMVVDGETRKNANEVTPAELNKWLSGIATQATTDAKLELFEQNMENAKIPPYMQIMRN